MQKRLLLSLLPVILLTIGIVSALTIVASNNAKDVAASFALTATGDFARELDKRLNYIAGVAESAARAIESQNELLEAEVYEQLEHNLAQDPLIYGSALGFAPGAFEGRPLFSPYIHRQGQGIRTIDIGANGYNYAATDDTQNEWYSRPNRTRSPIWTAPYFDEGAGNVHMVTYSVPIIKQGAFIGVVTVDVELNGLRNAVDTPKAIGFKDFFVLTDNEQFVLNPLSARQGETLELHDLLNEDDDGDVLNAVHALLLGDREFSNVSLLERQEGDGWLFAHILTSSDWTLLAETNNGVISNTALRIQLFGFAAGLILVFIYIFGAVKASRFKVIAEENESKYQNRLVRKLLVFGIVPLFVLVAGIVAYSSVSTFERERDSAETNLRNLAQRVALEVERSNTRAVLAAQMMAYAQVNGMFGRRVESVEYGRQVLSSMPEFTGAYFGYEPDADGNDNRFLNSTEADGLGSAMNGQGRFIPYLFRDQINAELIRLEPLQDMESSLYYQGNKEQFMANGEMAMVTEPYTYEGKLIVEQSYPIVIDGQFKGIAGIDRALDDLSAFIAEIKLREGADVFLLSRSDRFIATTTEEDVLLQTKALSGTEYADIFGPLIADVTSRPITISDDPFADDAFYFIGAHVPTGNWKVVVRAREKNITDPVWSDVWREIYVGLAVVATLAALGLWFAGSLSRRVQRAVTSADQIAQGVIPSRLLSADAGYDEIGRLSYSFDQVVEFYKDIEKVCIAIAAGDFSQTVTPRGESDRLSIAINEMAAKRQVAEADLRRLTEDAAQETKLETALRELSSGANSNMVAGEIANHALNFIVSFLSLPMGAVYVKATRDGDPRFEAVASWAYDGSDSQVKSFALNEGFVGQAASSGRTLITEGHSSGVVFQFGFGDVKPSQILHVPMTYLGDSIGVIELASVDSLNSQQIEWLEKAATAVAAAIQIAQGSERLKTAFAEARAARQRAQKLLDNSPDPTVIVRPNGMIEYVNVQAAKSFGYAQNELPGEHVEVLIPNRFREGHDVNMASVFKANKSRSMGEGQELYALAKDGHEIPVDVSLSPIEFEGETVVVASLRDVTARKEAEEKLRESQQLLEGVIENNAAVCYAKDKDGRYLLVNKVWEDVVGVARDQAIGYTDHDFMPTPEIAEDLRSNDLEVMKNGVAVEFEETVQAGDIPHVFLSIKFPLFDGDGNVTGICGMSTDISERKRMEEDLRVAMESAEAATKAKGDFLASMSHEIRTPMNGITGMADLLSQTGLDDDQKHMVRTIRDSGNSLITIINDILDFSKIEAGKLDIEDVSMAVADTLESVATTLTPNATKKKIRIHTFVDPDIPESVHGDPVRVRQILFNLAGNAIKFSDGKDVEIKAELLKGIRDDGRVVVRFELVDQGIGISAENQAKLFQAFSQAESSTTRKYGGTGLGLAICMRLTELMEGEIGVISTEGKGSTFWVELPLLPADRSRLYEKPRDLQGLNVLIVGSTEPRRSTLNRYLAHWGCDVVEAVDFDRAATLLQSAVADQTPPDTIVLDLDLNAETQKRAISQLRDAQGQGEARVPLIVLEDFQKRDARIQDKDIVTVDINPLLRYRFVTAIAVAVGRASPQPAPAQEDVLVETKKAPTVEEAAETGELILLAEDNVTNQDVIRRQLNLLGYVCEIANDGKEALAAWHTGRYCMLLTDCHMPEMDGYELTGSIRELEKSSGARSPIVAITANALQGEADRCLAAGMDDYLSKPVDMKALQATLQKWMPAPEHVSTALTDSSAKALKHEGNDSRPFDNESSRKQEEKELPIDDRVLKDMFGDDEGTFKEILASFVEPSLVIVEEIESGWKSKDAEEVKQSAHKLKSSARSVGANELADICLQLEQAGAETDWPAIDDLAPKLDPLMQYVVKYVEALA